MGSWAVAAPDFIQFQGRLTDREGRPIEGQPQVKFEIYPSEQGGSSIWSSLQHPRADGQGLINVEANESGLFAVDIGPFDDDFFSLQPDYYLQVYVWSTGGLQALKPRKKLNSVPFSMQSKQSDRAGVAEGVVNDSIGSVHIKDGEIQGGDLAPDGITSIHIRDGSIAFIDLKEDSVQSPVIKDKSIEFVDLATGAVRSSNIEDGSIQGKKLEAETITSKEIKDNSLQTSDMALGAVTTDIIFDETIQPIDLSLGAVNSAAILDESIKGIDLEDKTVPVQKIDLDSFATAGLSFVPRGAIFMFLNACPAGYSEVVQLRNRFPVGADRAASDPTIPNSPGQTSGTVSHGHDIDHGHGMGATNLSGLQEISTLQDWVFFNRPKLIQGYNALGNGDWIFMRGYDHSHDIQGSDKANTDPLTLYPPNYTVIFCQKN